MCKEETRVRRIGTADYVPLPKGHTMSMGYVDSKQVWIDSRGVVHSQNPKEDKE